MNGVSDSGICTCTTMEEMRGGNNAFREKRKEESLSPCHFCLLLLREAFTCTADQKIPLSPSMKRHQVASVKSTHGFCTSRRTFHIRHQRRYLPPTHSCWCNRQGNLQYWKVAPNHGAGCEQYTTTNTTGPPRYRSLLHRVLRKRAGLRRHGRHGMAVLPPHPTTSLSCWWVTRSLLPSSIRFRDLV